MNFKKETIGDVLELMTNGINCKQNKKGNGVKISRIETIANREINYQKTGFSKLTEVDKKKYKLIKGDILFSHINSPIHVGKTAIYNGKEDLYHGINLLKLRVKKHISPNYFKHFLDEVFQSGYWRRTSKQSVNQASVNQTDIKKIDFFYPPLMEQQRIVAKLDASFIETNKVIVKLENQEMQLNNLFKSILKTYFENESLQGIKLKNVLKITSSKRVLKSHYVSSGVPFYRTKEIKELANNKLVSTKLFISRNRFDDFKKKFDVPKSGDILITAIGTIGEVYIVKDDDEFYFKDGNILWMKDISKLNSYYLRYALIYFVDKINKLAHGAAYSALPINKLKEYKIHIPSLQEQTKIVSKLDKISKHVFDLKKINTKKISNFKTLDNLILSQELKSKAA